MIEEMVPSGRSESDVRLARADCLDALRAFWDRCNSHDWHYEMSDDHDKWARGTEERRQLERDAARGPEQAEMFARFRIWAGSIGRGEAAAKPVRP